MIFTEILTQKLNSDFLTCCALRKKQYKTLLIKKISVKNMNNFFFVFLKEYTVCIKMSAHAQNLTVNCAYSTLGIKIRK